MQIIGLILIILWIILIFRFGIREDRERRKRFEHDYEVTRAMTKEEHREYSYNNTTGKIEAAKAIFEKVEKRLTGK